jgi:hypothetical protein
MVVNLGIKKQFEKMKEWTAQMQTAFFQAIILYKPLGTFILTRRPQTLSTIEYSKVFTATYGRIVDVQGIK